MRTPVLLLGTAALLAVAVPLAASAQTGTTESRSGMGNAAHPTVPSNSTPAGSTNATSGPQSQPAYPSGSTTPNPGAAFVRNTPVPATGPAAGSPGNLSTTTVTPGGGAVQQPASPGVGEAGPQQQPQAPRR